MRYTSPQLWTCRNSSHHFESIYGSSLVGASAPVQGGTRDAAAIKRDNEAAHDGGERRDLLLAVQCPEHAQPTLHSAHLFTAAGKV